MYLSNLYLKNFRNYEELKINFNSKLNIFIGENAQGKTNILESIFFCSLLKSHRTNKINNLIRFGEDMFIIEIKGKKDNSKDIETNIVLNSDGKKFISSNNLKVQKISDFIGYIKVVMFSPEDLKIIKESPVIRRKFLDMSISQLDNKYLKYIIGYNKVLNMKNILLKNEIIDDTLLDVYDYQISTFSEFIIRKRIDYIKYLNKFSCELHDKISNFNEKLKIIYKTFLNLECDELEENIDIRSEIFDILKKNRKNDKIKRFSTIGIHRDDFVVYLNERQIFNYSSQGQQRSATISIKLAIVEMIKKFTGEYPVLLLDDILSELDKSRRNFVLNFIENIQTFITGTDINECISNDYSIFNIKNGMVL